MNYQTPTSQKVKELVDEKPELLEELKTDPIKTLEKIEKEYKPTTDKWIYRITVGTLSLVCLTIVIGVFILVMIKPVDYDVPDIFTALASAAIGAIAGLLAPSPNQS